MDDDLQTLGALLAKPEPSDEAVDRARHRLRDAIDTRAGRRRNRTVWFTTGVGLTAAAAAVAAVLIPSGHTHLAPAATGQPSQTSQPGQTSQTGRQILLAAATTAATVQPGTYWHYKISMGAGASYETWFAHDGAYWNACAAPRGTAVFEGPGLAGYGLGGGGGKGNAKPEPVSSKKAVPVGGGNLTYDETQLLPTSPAALTRWLTRYDQTDISLADTLIALQSLVPAPPQVRAAAYRALAAFPDVKSLGRVEGGQALLISFPAGQGWIKLVIDPVTALVRGETDMKGSTTIESAGWTNQLPRVVPLSSASGC